MPIQRFRGPSEAFTPYRSTAVAPMCGGFVVCPLAISLHSGHPGGWAPDLYRLAYEQAWNALRPPRHVRQMFASMN